MIRVKQPFGPVGMSASSHVKSIVSVDKSIWPERHLRCETQLSSRVRRLASPPITISFRSAVARACRLGASPPASDTGTEPTNKPQS